MQNLCKQDTIHAQINGKSTVTYKVTNIHASRITLCTTTG
jgi:hypothetical protein